MQYHAYIITKRLMNYEAGTPETPPNIDTSTPIRILKKSVLDTDAYTPFFRGVGATEILSALSNSISQVIFLCTKFYPKSPYS